MTDPTAPQSPEKQTLQPSDQGRSVGETQHQAATTPASSGGQTPMSVDDFEQWNERAEWRKMKEEFHG